MPRLLVVDGHIPEGYALGILASSFGYDVEVVGDAKSALDRVERGGIDFVIAGVRTPWVAGVEDAEAAFKVANWAELSNITSAVVIEQEVEGYFGVAQKYGVGKIFAIPVFNVQKIEELQRCLRMWTSGQGMFGLEHYINTNLIHGEDLLAYEATTPAFERIVKFAEELGFDNRQVFQIRLILDEMASNVFFHAYGFSKKTPRDEIVLPEGEKAMIRYGGTEERLGIEVIDTMGKHTKRRALETLATCQAQKTRKQAVGGEGGRGTYITEQVAKECYLNIEPGKRTQIIAVYTGDMTYTSLLIHEVNSHP